MAADAALVTALTALAALAAGGRAAPTDDASPAVAVVSPSYAKTAVASDHPE